MKKIIIGVVVLAVVGIGGYLYADWWRNNHNERVVRYDDPVEHFKYGSLGTEKRLGVPKPIFKVLPKLFGDLLPEGREGQGLEKLGFLFEKGKEFPIGTTLREMPVVMVGLNCALCHTGTLRDTPGGHRKLIFGAPANNFFIEDYINWLRKIGKDPRATRANIYEAIKDDPELGFVDRLIYRFAVIDQFINTLKKDVDEDNAWLDKRPQFGPGRVDTFNPYKAYYARQDKKAKKPAEFDMSKDDTIGTSDFPAIFNQQPREGMELHWDGNNNSVEERNKSAAIGAGAEPETLDLPEMQRIVDWIVDLQAPPFPADKIDKAKAEQGKAVWARACAACHDFGGALIGKVTPNSDPQLAVDPSRLDSWSEQLARRHNELHGGEGATAWHFSHFKKTNGYANAPLERVWIRAPFLHNGSVPTLRALLWPEERPKVFYRAYDVYDYQNVGFVSSGPEAEKLGWKFDTSERGNSNAGHLWGTTLPHEEREALLEFMKTL